MVQDPTPFLAAVPVLGWIFSMRRLLAVLVLLGVLPGAGGAAEDATSPGLRYQASLDVPLTLAGVAGTLGPRLLTHDGTAWTCRWCDRDADGHDTLNGLDAAIRRHWRWSRRDKAHEWSNVTLVLSLVAPAGAFAGVRGGFGNGFGEEMLLVVESSAVAMALTQGTKHLLRRQRPWAHAEDPPGGDHMGSRNANLSFVSGHASLAFALAVSTGSLASLRGDEGKEWVWASGLTLAAATGYLRIAADRHYFTDVLAGAALGATVGWVVPRLVDRKPTPGPEGAAARARARSVALFTVALGAGRGSDGRRSGVLLTGGLHGGGPYVSATWGF
jgi:membrane-associated phospholipid phosphatase